ncbi:MAG TPA: IS1634 family transposase [Isosphaeraceae bacterium]|nr:IS1634 family transposase [Isosphaeraceae bacterium]
MFLKRCERRKGGKKHTYWVLVESYRTPRGSRHRVVAYLGGLSRGEASGWAQLGRTLSGKRRTRPQHSLFDPPHYDEPDDDEPVLVKLKDIHLERLRSFGDVWLAWGLWRLLELDVLLDRIMPRGREEIPWSQMAAILTIARLCEPSSELHIEDTWYRGTALDDLLGIPAEKVHTDRLYAGLDHLLPHKDELERHLRQRLGDLFDLKYELLLYDITSTYFEGQCAANPLARRGYSRDNRPDCLQVLIGLVVTEDGFPLGYEVFAGNRNDSTTVDEMVTAMEQKYGQANRVWVMDRGMVSEENIARLHRSNASYIVGTPKAMLRRFERELTDQRDWHTVQEGVDVKRVSGLDGKEVFILARSADRQAKEQAMHQRFLERLGDGLRKLESAMNTGHLRDEGLANRRLGRLLEKNWRAAGAFTVRIERLPQPVGKARLKITWERNQSWNEWASIAEGCYILRSNLCDVEAVTLWKRYIQLTEAEWAFRIAKDELVIRPIWHQKEHRVRAHILVCFLAYVLWKTLAGWMQRAGLGDAPRTLLEEFAKIRSGDVVLQAQSHLGGPSRTIRLRCVPEPDAAQKVLLSRLGLTLPRRLRRIDEDAKALTANGHDTDATLLAGHTSGR